MIAEMESFVNVVNNLINTYFKSVIWDGVDSYDII